MESVLIPYLADVLIQAFNVPKNMGRNPFFFRTKQGGIAFTNLCCAH